MLEIIDALYGHISLDIEKEALVVPELQRLRSIRLCNVNSPYITGGDGLNRFEHAIGTAYLAQEIVKDRKIEQIDRDAFVLAALYHDIVTASFGHSLEYLFESVTGDEYEHSNIWLMFLSGRTIQTSRPIYYGYKFSLNTVVDHKIIEKISKILSGKHELSKFIANDIDIDNIDNVYRFAYHIGIKFDPEIPLILSKSLKYYDGSIIVDDRLVGFLSNWFKIRERLYIYLLENVGEFSAKALLERAFIESIKEEIISVDDWILTDFEILQVMFKDGNKVTRDCIQRLMTMKFYNHSKVLICYNYEVIDNYLKYHKLSIIDKAFFK